MTAEIKLPTFLAVPAISLGLMVTIPTQPAHAAADCNLNTIVKSYKSGLRHAKRRNYDRALAQWRPLARAGFGPAQRQLAGMYATGRGLKKSLPLALLWAELGSAAADEGAAKLVQEIGQKVQRREADIVRKRMKAWKPAPVVCENGRIRLAAKGEPAPTPTFTLSTRKNADDALLGRSTTALEAVLAHARRDIPSASLYLFAVDGFEFYKGERYHRYVDWKIGEKKNILKFAASNFEDKGPSFAAQTIVLIAKRRVYQELEESQLADTRLRTIQGIKLVGANYPDVRNQQFFEIVAKALEMGRRLPEDLQKFIKIIDEMQYNPPSKHFVKSGTLDASAGYYNKRLSSNGHRLIFFRRQVLFSSPLFFLRTIVHEGTHATQDARAWRQNREIPRLRSKLKKLGANGEGNSAEAKELHAEIEKMHDYVVRWYKGIETSRGRIQDIEFECEATMNEIRTVQALNGSPDMMKDSGYIKVCPIAQRALVQWRDERLRNSRRR